MKIIGRDNFDREHIDDILICENLTAERAQWIVRALNIVYCKGDNAPRFYQVVDDNHQLRVFKP